MTDDELPSPEAVRELQEHLVLDKEGKSRTFRSLYNGRNSARRVLVIFIRHFFCGVCESTASSSCPTSTSKLALMLCRRPSTLLQ